MTKFESKVSAQKCTLNIQNGKTGPGKNHCSKNFSFEVLKLLQ